MTTLTLQKIGNSIGGILPKEVLSRITKSANEYSISSFDPDSEETIAS
ncbi:hypothetical protein MTo_00208 [Microcystis aeruginosa NIES-1211]|uniref:Uncharacterized protein n=1 Tax=Microcystis aeruginosa NIES-2519 TaxID=2303981 RepID=A0A5A5R5P3_MICAE